MAGEVAEVVVVMVVVVLVVCVCVCLKRMAKLLRVCVSVPERPQF